MSNKLADLIETLFSNQPIIEMEISFALLFLIENE